MAMVFCRGCGKEIQDSAPFCSHCGALNAAVPVHSGLSEVLPDGVKGWSWGAFFLNWIWAIGNKTWIGLIAIVPFVGWVMCIVLGFKGREWAWKNSSWKSLEHFNRVQRLWSIWGWILGFGLILIGILAAVALPAYQDYTTRAKASEVILSMSGARTALAERMQNSPKAGLLTEKEVQGIRDATIPSKYVAGADYYSVNSYADVVTKAKIGNVEGDIYIYTRDAGGSWVCGSDNFPLKYLPQSCRDTGGVNRPPPPKPEPSQNIGLWTRKTAAAMYNSCFEKANEKDPTKASSYCKCVVLTMSASIPEDVMQAGTPTPELEAIIKQAIEACQK